MSAFSTWGSAVTDYLPRAQGQAPTAASTGMFCSNQMSAGWSFPMTRSTIWGRLSHPPSGEELIAGLRRLIARAHAKDIQFLCSTLTPFEGANYWTAEEEEARETFNAFVRSQTSGCDAVVDQDRATYDSAHPAWYLAAYDSGDHLHPNDAGHKAIAGAVDLGFFAKLSQSINKR